MSKKCEATWMIKQKYIDRRSKMHWATNAHSF